jgi:protein-S-isoprenylcysteine O-methyltransferase Ste14
MGTILLILSSALWVLIHSLLASLKIKEGVLRMIGPSAMNGYRLGYNLFSVISFLPILVLAAVLPDKFLYSIPGPWVEITLIIQLMAVLALVVGVIQTDIGSFIGLKQVMGGTINANIVTGGLYRYVRHPLYTAGLVFIWLTPVMTLNRLALYLSLTIYILIGVYFEERKLLREFGNAYEDYRLKTPMLIPVLFKRR